MGRKRKIFTKREYEKLQKTHEGRQKINKTYAFCALCSFFGAITIGIIGVLSEYLKVLAVIGFLGAFICICVFMLFVMAYKSENAEEQERISRARANEQIRIERAIQQAKYKAEEERIRFKKLKESNIDEVDQMNGYQFEEFVKLILSDLGYTASTTKKSGDFGVDLIVEKDDEKIIIQTKRYANKVSLSAVQEVSSAKNYYNVQSAWVVTNNYFTDSAKKLAHANEIKLIDRDDLIELIIQAKQTNQEESA